MRMTWSPPAENSSLTPGRELFKRILGEDLDPEAAFGRIEAGISSHALDAFLKTFHADADTLGDVLKISARTLARRRAQGRLTSVESDRFYRLLALYARAADVLGSIQAADEWMRGPALALGNKTPLTYAGNEAGERRVEVLLTRIEHGVYS